MPTRPFAYLLATLPVAAALFLAAAPARADVIDATHGPTLFMTEGNFVSNLLLATFSTDNTSLAAADFFASVNWGDGNTSTGAISTTATGFSVAGDHTYADEGSYTPSIHLTSNDNGDATVLDVATVSDAPLSNGSLNTGSLVEGTPLNGVIASFQDANPGADLSDFTATINWGDGHSDTASITLGQGGFNINGTHTYADEGSYSIDIQVQDKGGSTLDIQGSALVTDAPLGGSPITLTPTTGVSLTTSVANLTDGNAGAAPSDFAAMINWGDGSSSLGAITGSGGAYQVNGTHTYSLSGHYVVETQINDLGGSTLTLDGDANVADPATAAPEPSTWLLTALAAAALASGRARK